MGKLKKITRTDILDYLNLTVGSILFAYGLVAFTTPNKIVPVGVTGIAHILQFLFSMPMGATILLVNIILVILQIKILGAKSAGKTMIVTVICSVAIDVLAIFKDKIAMTMDPLMASIFGSIICGVGIAMTFKGGGNTGGMDIVSQICHHKWNIPITDTLMASNIAVVLLAGYIFGMMPMLYSITYVYLSNVVIDAFLDGMPVFRNVFIITKNPDVVGWAIIEELRRGVTSLNATGIYSGKEVSILLTAIRRGELHALEKIIYKYDHHAFVIVGDARRIIGQGFTKLEDEVRFDGIEIDNPKDTSNKNTEKNSEEKQVEA